MNVHEITLSVEQFESHCAQLMEEISAQDLVIVITKDGQPIARLVSAGFESPLPPAELYGAMAGMATMYDDLVAPLDERWDADR